MDIELQNLIEQDIDLGIKQNAYFDYETGTCSNKNDMFKFGTTTNGPLNDFLFKEKNLLNGQFEESLKVKKK